MRKKFINLSLVLASICFAFLLSELIIRIFLPQNLIYNNKLIWRPDAKFGWRHHENLNIKVNLGEGEVTFRTDEQGFRINEGYKPSQDSLSQNVLVLGDSFLEGVQVEHFESTSMVLQKSLNRKSGINTKFYNSAVAGWNPNHYFLESQRILDEDLLKIDKVVVFLYLANDIVSHEIDSFRESQRVRNSALQIPRSFDRYEWNRSIIYPVGDYLSRNSHLFTFVKRRNNGLFTKLSLSSYYFPWVFESKNQALSNWEVTTRICKKIQKAFGQNSTEVSFVLIPTAYQVNEEVMEKYIEYFDISPDSIDLEQPNRILKRLFSENAMSLYDPLKFFRQKAKNGSELYGTIDRHFNAQGHAIMSEYLLPILSKELMK